MTSGVSRNYAKRCVDLNLAQHPPKKENDNSSRTPQKSSGCKFTLVHMNMLTAVLIRLSQGSNASTKSLPCR